MPYGFTVVGKRYDDDDDDQPSSAPYGFTHGMYLAIGAGARRRPAGASEAATAQLRTRRTAAPPPSLGLRRLSPRRM